MRCSQCRKEISGLGKPVVTPGIPIGVALGGGLLALTLGNATVNGWMVDLGSLGLATLLVWLGFVRRKCPGCGSTQLLDAAAEEALVAQERDTLRKTTEAELRTEIEWQLRPEIAQDVRAGIEAELRSAYAREAGETRAALEKEIEKQLRASMERQLRTELEKQRSRPNEQELRKKLEEELRPEIEQKLRPVLEAELQPRLERTLRHTIEHELRPELEREVRAQLAAEMRGKPDSDSGLMARGDDGKPAGKAGLATVGAMAFPRPPTSPPGLSQPPVAPPIAKPAAKAPPPPVSSPVVDHPSNQTTRGKTTDGTSEDARAQRRARVILSDLSLYNKDALVSAAQSADAKKELGGLWKDAIRSYNQTVPPEVRNTTNYLEEELERYLARLRKG